MSFAHLEQLVDDINFWAELKGEPKMNAHQLTQADADKIYHKIDGNLSPEILACDGEASPAQVKRTYRMLTGAVSSLDAKFNRPDGLYEIDEI